MFEFILNYDRSLFTLINSQWTNPIFDSFFPFITDLHKNSVFQILIIPLLLIIFYKKLGLKRALFLFLFSSLTVLISDFTGTQLFKNTVQRERPANDPLIHSTVRSPFGGYSFVSNHATNNFAFAVYTSAIIPSLAPVLFTIATLVSYSRIYNGVHYPTDVVAGAVLGVLIALIMLRLTQRFYTKKH